MELPSFPAGDLPAAASAALFAAYIAPEAPRLPDRRSPERPDRPLTAEERVRGLATIWGEATYQFAYWDRLPGEAWWDAQFEAFLPRVLAAPSDAAHWDLLQAFARLLGDGHTGVRLPWEQAAVATPALSIELVEGRPTVTAGEALPPGAVIVAVDGRDAEEVLAERAALLPASTEHHARAVAAALLLRGPLDAAATVRARLPDGATREVVLERVATVPAEPCVARDLGDGVGHVALTSFRDDRTAQAFHDRFLDFAGVRGLILDLRHNPGGSSSVGYAILARLLRRPARGSAQRMRVVIPTMRAWGYGQRWLVRPAGLVRPDMDRPRFAGPVAVLAGPLTGSAAEDFLVAYRQARRGPIVGEPTAGSTGQPVFIPLPGGAVLFICTKRDTYADGTPFVGVGVAPDLPCAPTLAGVAAGRDEPLELAIRQVREKW